MLIGDSRLVMYTCRRRNFVLRIVFISCGRVYINIQCAEPSSRTSSIKKNARCAAVSKTQTEIYRCVFIFCASFFRGVPLFFGKYRKYFCRWRDYSNVGLCDSRRVYRFERSDGGRIKYRSATLGDELRERCGYHGALSFRRVKRGRGKR